MSAFITRIPTWLKKELSILAVALLFVAAAFVFGSPPPEGGIFYSLALLSIKNIVFIAFMCSAWLIAGWNVISGAVRHILHGHIFDELFLMTIATLGALVIGAYEEALGVMIFYKLGELLQEAAQERSRESITSLLNLRPEFVRVRKGSSWEKVDPANVPVDTEYMVMPGERLGLDGSIVQGESWMDTQAISGESKPRKAVPGDAVCAGYITSTGSLIIRATHIASESQIARIVHLVEEASHRKARAEKFISRFAAVYTPIIVVIALVIALLPPLLFQDQSLRLWIYRALVILVISCPCALVVSVPLGYFAGLGGAAKRGILIKGSSMIDSLSRVKNVLFDKTGTITEGKFRVLEILPAASISAQALLTAAVAAEKRSLHPIAAAVREAAAAFADSAADSAIDSAPEPTHVVEKAGAGIIVTFAAAHNNNEKKILAGNMRLMDTEGIAVPTEIRAALADESEIFIAENGVYLGALRIGDALKTDSAATIQSLRSLGVQRIAMLSGDARSPAEKAGLEAGIDEIHAALLPEDKLRILESVIEDTKKTGSAGTTVFVGDGVNDAPVLARADIGVAMGAGADAAVENADIVLLSDEPSRLPEAIMRAKYTQGIVLQNTIFAIGFKVCVLLLSTAGLATMWGAVVADVGVALLAVANSMRAARLKVPFTTKEKMRTL